MDQEKQIRKQIFAGVKALYDLRMRRGKNRKARVRVGSGGRVYDHRELFNLVDSSLDFWLTAGRYARRFERGLARFLGVKHCVLVNSGSSANLLALSALTSPQLGERRLMDGDEVITTACGFPTTLNPIIQNRLVPVFIDVDRETYNIRAESIQRAIGKRTKAIFIAHTLGNPADLGVIMRLVKKYKLWFIEDNCDALGAVYNGRLTGSFGHLSACSFYPGHHITMGEGGAVLTDDPLLKKIVLSFRDWGRDCWCEPGHDNTCGERFSRRMGTLPVGYDHKYTYSHIGYNMKITDMQAAVGAAQLRKLPGFIQKRKKNFDFLLKKLSAYKEFFSFPRVEKGAVPSWFGFPLLIGRGAPFTRAQIISYLEQRHISTRMLFGGNLTRQPAYATMKYRAPMSLQNTDFLMNNLFWIGVYPGIDKQMLEYVTAVFGDFMKRKA
jgi:CDP-6-deoxy-D-xylo-4-hexulose-3-dehydrase